MEQFELIGKKGNFKTVQFDPFNVDLSRSIEDASPGTLNLSYR